MLNETRYLILINMYAENGYVETGHFNISDNEPDALEVFNQLKGTPIEAEKALLRLDFVARSEQGLDTILRTLGCTLCEMSENIKIIMKETFRMLNLM